MARAHSLSRPCRLCWLGKYVDLNGDGCLARGVESAAGRQKPWEASGGMARCPRNRMGNGSKVPVHSIPKAHTWLPDCALAPGVRNCG